MNIFISIKVDREERPDVDQVYMNAAQLISGSGGWPLNALAMPDGKPFYAGTYFPKKTGCKCTIILLTCTRKTGRSLATRRQRLHKVSTLLRTYLLIKQQPHLPLITLMKQVSIAGFRMDATEITNNEYRQFEWWVRDSLAAKELGFGKETDGNFVVDWKKAQTIKYNDKSVLEKISKLTLTPDNRLYGRNEIDPEKLLFR